MNNEGVDLLWDIRKSFIWLFADFGLFAWIHTHRNTANIEYKRIFWYTDALVRENVIYYTSKTSMPSWHYTQENESDCAI